MVKAILFDFWGTLIEQGVYSPVKQIRSILNIRLPFPEYVVRLERAMMTKQFADLKEAFQEVGKEFGIEIPEKKMEELIGMWNKNWMLAQPYPETEEVLQELKKNNLLILVANTDCFSVEKVLEKLQWQKYFDEMVLSCKVKMIKTDPNFLGDILSRLNLELEDCVLVGDSIQSDIIPAKRIGMKAILIDRKGHRDFEQKISTLKELSEIW